MVSDKWRNNDWNCEPGFKYVDSCMTSSRWWDEVKTVLDIVGPLYFVLHYVDGVMEMRGQLLMPILLRAIKDERIKIVQEGDELDF